MNQEKFCKLITDIYNFLFLLTELEKNGGNQMLMVFIKPNVISASVTFFVLFMSVRQEIEVVKFSFYFSQIRNFARATIFYALYQYLLKLHHLSLAVQRFLKFNI